MSLSVANSAKNHAANVDTVDTSNDPVDTQTHSAFVISLGHDPTLDVSRAYDNMGNPDYVLVAKVISGATAVSFLVCNDGTGGTGHFGIVELSGNTYPGVFFAEVRDSDELPVSVDLASLGTRTDDDGTPFTVTSGDFDPATSLALLAFATDGAGVPWEYTESTGFTQVQVEDNLTDYYGGGLFAGAVTPPDAITPSVTSNFTPIGVALAVVGFKTASAADPAFAADQVAAATTQSATLAAKAAASSAQTAAATTQVATAGAIASIPGGGGGAPVDPYWNNVSFLLNGDSATGLVDAKGHSITNVGATAIVTTDPSFPLGAVYFDGTTKYLNFAQTGTEFEFPGPLTIELTYKPISKPAGSINPNLLSFENTFAANGGFALYDRHSSNPTKFSMDVNGTYPAPLGSTVISNGTTYDIAITRNASNLVTLWVNGVSVGTATFSGTMKQIAGVWLGAGGINVGTTKVNGYVKNVRFTQGVCRYTGTYTPTSGYFPTAGYPVNAQTADPTTQVATIAHGGVASVSASQTAAPTTQSATLAAVAALAAAQTAEPTTQVATLAGTSTISITATQTAEPTTQTATLAAEASASAAQTAQATTQVAALGAAASASAAQTAEATSQAATVIHRAASAAAAQVADATTQAATVIALAQLQAAQTTGATTQEAAAAGIAALRAEQLAQETSQLAHLARAYLFERNERTFIVQAEDRVFTGIEAELRTHFIEAEDRGFAVAAEDRLFTIGDDT